MDHVEAAYEMSPLFISSCIRSQDVQQLFKVIVIVFVRTCIVKVQKMGKMRVSVQAKNRNYVGRWMDSKSDIVTGKNRRCCSLMRTCLAQSIAMFPRFEPCVIWQ